MTRESFSHCLHMQGSRHEDIKGPGPGIPASDHLQSPKESSLDHDGKPEKGEERLSMFSNDLFGVPEDQDIEPFAQLSSSSPDMSPSSTTASKPGSTEQYFEGIAECDDDRKPEWDQEPKVPLRSVQDVIKTFMPACQQLPAQAAPRSPSLLATPLGQHSVKELKKLFSPVESPISQPGTAQCDATILGCSEISPVSSVTRCQSLPVTINEAEAVRGSYLSSSSSRRTAMKNGCTGSKNGSSEKSYPNRSTSDGVKTAASGKCSNASLNHKLYASKSHVAVQGNVQAQPRRCQITRKP
jgi:hypothetical protein